MRTKLRMLLQLQVFLTDSTPHPSLVLLGTALPPCRYTHSPRTALPTTRRCRALRGSRAPAQGQEAPGGPSVPAATAPCSGSQGRPGDTNICPRKSTCHDRTAEPSTYRGPSRTKNCRRNFTETPRECFYQNFLGDLRSLVRFVSFWKKRAKSE